MRNLLIITLVAMVTFAGKAQHQLVFETGDTVSCAITNVSNAYVYFLNDEQDSRKVTVSFLKAVNYEGKWWKPLSFRDAYMTKDENENRSLMYASNDELGGVSNHLSNAGVALLLGPVASVVIIATAVLINADDLLAASLIATTIAFIGSVVAGIELINAGKSHKVIERKIREHFPE